MDTNRRSSKRQQKIPNHFNDFVHDLYKRKESGKSKGNNGKNKNGNECLDQAIKECLDQAAKVCLDKNISQNGLFKELAECKDSDTQVNKGVNVPADKVKFSSVNDEMLANNAGCCNLKLSTEKETRMDPSVCLDMTEPKKLPLWVKLKNMPLEAWSVKGISVIASRIGTPQIMDQITSNMCRVGTGRVGFARVLVEVKAEKGLPDTIEIEYMNCEKVMTGKKYVKVEYYWAPALCSFCKVFGHNDKKCSIRPKTDEELEELKKAEAQKSEVNDDFVQVNQRKKHINIPKVKPKNEGNKLGTKNPMIKNPMMFKPVVREKAPNSGNREEEITRNDDGRNNMKEPGSPKTMIEPVSPKTSPGWNVNKNIIESIRKSANKYYVLTDLTEGGGTLENHDPVDLEEVDLEEVDVYEDLHGSASKMAQNELHCRYANGLNESGDGDNNNA
ncbi:RNA-directed DNA polymerase, eukaryota, reverse transcriptase zinc-binding domain protein [Tanacetum coccineum]